MDTATGEQLLSVELGEDIARVRPAFVGEKILAEDELVILRAFEVLSFPSMKQSDRLEVLKELKSLLHMVHVRGYVLNEEEALGFETIARVAWDALLDSDWIVRLNAIEFEISMKAERTSPEGLTEFHLWWMIVCAVECNLALPLGEPASGLNEAEPGGGGENQDAHSLGARQEEIFADDDSDDSDDILLQLLRRRRDQRVERVRVRELVTTTTTTTTTGAMSNDVTGPGGEVDTTSSVGGDMSGEFGDPELTAFLDEDVLWRPIPYKPISEYNLRDLEDALYGVCYRFRALRPEDSALMHRYAMKLFMRVAKIIHSQGSGRMFDAEHFRVSASKHGGPPYAVNGAFVYETCWIFTDIFPILNDAISFEVKPFPVDEAPDEVNLDAVIAWLQGIYRDIEEEALMMEFRRDIMEVFLDPGERQRHDKKSKNRSGARPPADVVMERERFMVYQTIVRATNATLKDILWGLRPTPAELEAARVAAAMTTGNADEVFAATLKTSGKKRRRDDDDNDDGDGDTYEDAYETESDSDDELLSHASSDEEGELPVEYADDRGRREAKGTAWLVRETLTIHLLETLLFALYEYPLKRKSVVREGELKRCMLDLVQKSRAIPYIVQVLNGFRVVMNGVMYVAETSLEAFAQWLALVPDELDGFSLAGLKRDILAALPAVEDPEPESGLAPHSDGLNGANGDGSRESQPYSNQLISNILDGAGGARGPRTRQPSHVAGFEEEQEDETFGAFLTDGVVPERAPVLPW